MLSTFAALSAGYAKHLREYTRPFAPLRVT